MKSNIQPCVDVSFKLYQKYFSLTNRTIEITLRNNQVLTGVFRGFYKGDEWYGEPYIIQWHFAESDNKLGKDPFGFLEGQIIEHKEILQITFQEDGNSMFLNQ